MLATLVPEPFHRQSWVSEEKVDGWRIVAHKDGRHGWLVSRTGRDHAARFPQIRRRDRPDRQHACAGCGPLKVNVQSHHRRIAMADSPNVSVVRRLYQARGNPEVIRQVLGSEVRWEVVDGFPHGAIYKGLDSVLRDFFGRLFTDFDEFVATGSEFFESGEHVIALGSYSGRARKSGKRFTARFAHVWTLQDGLIVRLQQCADTVQLARALGD